MYPTFSAESCEGPLVRVKRKRTIKEREKIEKKREKGRKEEKRKQHLPNRNSFSKFGTQDSLLARKSPYHYRSQTSKYIIGNVKIFSLKHFCCGTSARKRRLSRIKNLNSKTAFSIHSFSIVIYIVFMLTTEGFFLPVTGLRPGTVGLDDVVVFFVTVTVLPLNLAFEIGLDVLSLAFDALLVAVVLFVVKVLLLLLVDSSDLTSAVTSSTSLSASS